ncbi:MAG: hypothetical protein AMJ45_01255 [Syntrophobacter sp. DG_60]|nr:MAG: hypothetical protein AMJ45_01255 [Syntrophobacter sp. DG_60]
MAIDLSKIFEGKKFMWDGMTYETEEQAKEVMERYKKDGFEVRTVKEGDQYLVYSRREVAPEKEGVEG